VRFTATLLSVFIFALFSPRLFQAIDFASRHFPLFFRRRRNEEKCVNGIVVVPLLSLHCQQFSLKLCQLMIICGCQMGKRKIICGQNENGVVLPAHTHTHACRDMCILFIIERIDQPRGLCLSNNIWSISRADCIDLAICHVAYTQRAIKTHIMYAERTHMQIL